MAARLMAATSGYADDSRGRDRSIGGADVDAGIGLARCQRTARLPYAGIPVYRKRVTGSRFQ